MSSVPETWALWVQAPLLAVLCVASAPMLRRAAVAVALSWRTLGAAAAAVALVAALLPPASGGWSGHEAHYGELLSGLPAEEGTLRTTSTFPAPAGLAWALGQLLPASSARGLWEASNRGSLGLLLIAMAIIGGLLGAAHPRQDEPSPSARAGPWVIALGLAATPLLGWSATYFAVVPAALCGSIGLIAALRGHLGLAIGWIAFGAGGRMEVAGLGLAALLLAGPSGIVHALRRDRRGLVVGGAVLIGELVSYAGKERGLPGLPDPAIAWENLSAVPLGGPYFGWGALTAAVLLVVVRRPAGLDGWRVGSWLVGLLACVAQITTLIDFGGRHLIPATVLLLPALAAALAAPAQVSTRALGLVAAAALAVSVVPATIRATTDLHHRFSADDAGVLPRWAAAAEHGPRGPRTAFDPRCLWVLPVGEVPIDGSRDAIDVGMPHLVAPLLTQGRCVLWGVRPWVRFRGDAQLEYLDRAVRALDLRPHGWLLEPGAVEPRIFVLRGDPS